MDADLPAEQPDDPFAGRRSLRELMAAAREADGDADGCPACGCRDVIPARDPAGFRRVVCRHCGLSRAHA